MKNKRGSHVGVIASFGVFVLFLVAIYFIAEPVITVQRDKQNMLEYLETNLIKEFSSNLTTAIVSSTGGSCLEVANSALEISDGLNAIVKDANNNVIGSQFSGNTLHIGSSSEQILWIYYSEVEFSSSSASCENYEPPTIESVRSSEQIFEKKITNAIEDYDNFVLRLNIPPGSEFGFTFEYNNGTQINMGEQDVTTNVYVKELPMQYIDKDANTLLGKLIIKTW